jgi:hypothetical protein
MLEGLNGIRIKVGEEAARDDPFQKGDEIGSDFALVVASEPLDVQTLASTASPDIGVFCTTPEKVYFSHTSPEWPSEPFHKCLMFQNLYGYVRIEY